MIAVLFSVLDLLLFDVFLAVQSTIRGSSRHAAPVPAPGGGEQNAWMLLWQSGECSKIYRQLGRAIDCCSTEQCPA